MFLVMTKIKFASHKLRTGEIIRVKSVQKNQIESNELEL